MQLQKGDTVKILAPFGLDEQGGLIFPDCQVVGKYGKVLRANKKDCDVLLFDGDSEYVVLNEHLEKITFFIIDSIGHKLRGKYTLESASEKLDELIEGESGYWYVYGSDDSDIPWIEGG